MAGGGVVTAGEIKHYPGRTTFFVCMVCVVAASGGLMFGYDVGISGSSCVSFCEVSLTAAGLLCVEPC